MDFSSHVLDGDAVVVAGAQTQQVWICVDSVVSEHSPVVG